MTAVYIIMKHAAAAISGGWTEFAAAYREAYPVFTATEQHPDDEISEAAYDAFAPLYHILLAYPVRTVCQLAEKTALLNMECWDKAAAFDAVSADLQRLAASPEHEVVVSA